MKTLPRRRFISILAAAGSLPLIGPAFAGIKPDANLQRWRGTAMGARSEILMDLPDPAQSARLVYEIRQEIERLERIFSLYRGDSALSHLNSDGELIDPPAELVELLEQAQRISVATEGAFDVTIQPLWQLYAESQGRPISDRLRNEVLKLVDYQAIEISKTGIRLGRPGMALTLNGIAQGYITDRITEMLRQEGMENTLVQMGEFAALGQHPDGRNWQVGIEDPGNPGSVLEKLDLLPGQALATSGNYGTDLGPGGHLLDPRTGLPSNQKGSLTVVANSALLADAWSTAMTIQPETGTDLDRASVIKAAWLAKDGRLISL